MIFQRMPGDKKNRIFKRVESVIGSLEFGK